MTVTSAATQTTYAAHIVTYQAVDLGEPLVLVMERADGVDLAVAEHIRPQFYAELGDALRLLTRSGWTPGAPVLVEPGYWVAAVTKEADL